MPLLLEPKIPEGCFENGDKVAKLCKNMIIEGRVFYVVEWEKPTNKLKPKNTIVSETELKEKIKLREFKNLVKQFLESGKFQNIYCQLYR